MIRIIIACVGIVLSLFSIGLAVWSLIRLRKWDRENEAYIQARNARYEELKKSVNEMSETAHGIKESLMQAEGTYKKLLLDIDLLEQCYNTGDSTDCAEKQSRSAYNNAND